MRPSPIPCPCGGGAVAEQTHVSGMPRWRYRCAGCGRKTRGYVNSYDARRVWPNVAKDPPPDDMDRTADRIDQIEKGEWP